MAAEHRDRGAGGLEDRLVPAAALGAFAHVADLTVAPQEPAAVVIHVRTEDFTMPHGDVVLAFVTHAATNSVLDPRSAAVVSLGGAFHTSILRKPDVAGDLSGLTLARVGMGDFTIRWRGQHGLFGATELDVFLAGDANADFRVDSRVLDQVRSRTGVRLGEAGYVAAADVNRNGVVGWRDLRLARMNLGAATSLRRPIVTANLSPDSDPDGNGVVLQSAVTVAGQTMQSGATVRLNVVASSGDVNSGHGVTGLQIRLQSVAGANGRFQFAVDLAPGLHTIRVTATDSFGQSIAVERTERPPMAARNLAIIHAAMYDALNEIDRSHEPYHVDLVAPAGASPVAAAAVAAQRVASNLYRPPDELAVLDEI